jgi:hypothetical protein
LLRPPNGTKTARSLDDHRPFGRVRRRRLTGSQPREGPRNAKNLQFAMHTNGLSKNLENHAATVALYLMYYNFGRVHQTLGVTPAMEAGISDHVWSIEEIVGLLGE